MLRTEHKKSFLGFPCVQCKHPIIVLSILAEMSAPTFENAAKVDLDCPSCHHKAFYALNEVRRYEQHQLI